MKLSSDVICVKIVEYFCCFCTYLRIIFFICCRHFKLFYAAVSAVNLNLNFFEMKRY